MIASFLPDTSCMVASVCAWHECHKRAADAIDSRLDSGERMIIAAPSLIETYSVLTRLPAPHRLAPADALNLVEANFVRSVKIVAIEAEEYILILRSAPAAGIAGGRAYDAVIAACARKGGARTLLTFNESHFRQFANSDLRVEVP